MESEKFVSVPWNELFKAKVPKIEDVFPKIHNQINKLSTKKLSKIEKKYNLPAQKSRPLKLYSIIGFLLTYIATSTTMNYFGNKVEPVNYLEEINKLNSEHKQQKDLINKFQNILQNNENDHKKTLDKLNNKLNNLINKNENLKQTNENLKQTNKNLKQTHKAEIDNLQKKQNQNNNKIIEDLQFELAQLQHDLGECNVEMGSCEQEGRQKDKLDELRREDIAKEKRKFNLCNKQLKKYKKKKISDNISDLDEKLDNAQNFFYY